MDNILKKIIASGLFLTALTASAHIPNKIQLSSAKKSFTGFYTSAGLGITSTQYRIQDSSSFATNGIAALTARSNNAAKAQQQALQGEFELGYGYNFKHSLFLGLAAFMDIARRNSSYYLNLTNSNNINNLKYSSINLNNITGGLTLNPGINISPTTLLYGNLGWTLASAKLALHQSVNITTAARGGISDNKTEYLNGLRLGVGVEQQLTSSFMLALDYIGTDYFHKIKLNSPVTNTTGPNLTGPFYYNTSRSITSDTLLAKLTYYWGQRPNFAGLPTIAAKDYSGFSFGAHIGTLNPQLSGAGTLIRSSYFDQGTSLQQPTLALSRQGDSAITTLNTTIGFSHVFRRVLFTAITASLNWGNHNIKSTVSHGFRPTTVAVGGQNPDTINNDTNISLWNFEPAIDARIGALLFNRVLWYMQSGITLNKMKLNAYTQLSYIDDNNNRESFSLTQNNKKNAKANYTIGTGLQFQFSPGTAIELNYDYTYYGKIGVSNTFNTTDAAGNAFSLSNNTHLRVATNTVTLGITHYL